MMNYFVKNCHGGLLGNTSTPARFSWRRRLGASPMALSMRALERNGCGGPLGGGRGHDRRRPLSLPPLPGLIVMFLAPPLLDFDGAICRRRHSQSYQRAPSIGTGADGPQAEERAKAADAHRIARVLCDEFLFFCFSPRGSEKNTVCQVVKKRCELWVSIRTV